MIYEDQPQMVEAVGARIGNANAPHVLREAFAAIDREAPIEKVLDRYEPKLVTRRKNLVEAILVAAGVIPERES